MDPLSQAVVGAAVPCTASKKETFRLAAVCGAIGGMAPDLDVVIRSSEDPLLFFEYHRQFTHSLAFIPFGGLIIGFLLWALFFRRHPFGLVFLFTTLGWATHGLIDSCTSFGTQLWWPFNNERVSWNVVSIIDPFFTLTLVAGLIIAYWRKSKKIMLSFSAVACLYFSYGIIAHFKVNDAAQELAKERGHTIVRQMVNPTIGNNWLWRSLYEADDGYYYADAVWTAPFYENRIKQGLRMKAINPYEQFPELPEGSTAYNDIARFAHFAKGYLFMHPKFENVVSDARYGTLPYDNRSFWGVEIDINKPNKHLPLKRMRQVTQSDWDEYWRLLAGDMQ